MKPPRLTLLLRNVMATPRRNAKRLSLEKGVMELW